MWRDMVQRWMEDNERSQSWLARKAGISGPYLNVLLSGKRAATENILKKLERATGILLRGEKSNAA